MAFGLSPYPQFPPANALKALLKSVHGRMRMLEEQRVALEEILQELRSIEQQANAALAALQALDAPTTLTKTRRRASAGAKLSGEQIEP